MQEDPIVVCIKLFFTVKKELDVTSFAPKPLSQHHGAYTNHTVWIQTTKGRVLGWSGRAGARYVRLEDAAAAIEQRIKTHRLYVERELASLTRASENLDKILAIPAKN